MCVSLLCTCSKKAISHVSRQQEAYKIEPLLTIAFKLSSMPAMALPMRCSTAKRVGTCRPMTLALPPPRSWMLCSSARNPSQSPTVCKCVCVFVCVCVCVCACARTACAEVDGCKLACLYATVQRNPLTLRRNALTCVGHGLHHVKHSLDAWALGCSPLLLPSCLGKVLEDKCNGVS